MPLVAQGCRLKLLAVLEVLEACLSTGVGCAAAFVARLLLITAGMEYKQLRCDAAVAMGGSGTAVVGMGMC